jgi:hypothetical protein
VTVTSSTLSGRFLIDKAEYPAYFGVQRGKKADDTSEEYKNVWNGFVYDFGVYQCSQAAGVANDFRNSCASGCWTYDFGN